MRGGVNTERRQICLLPDRSVSSHPAHEERREVREGSRDSFLGLYAVHGLTQIPKK